MNWIPVTERLPKEHQKCFVTVGPINGRPSSVRIATFIPNLTTWEDGIINYTKTRDVWSSYDDEDDHYYRLEGVIAWMPFPKPYKEEE